MRQSTVLDEGASEGNRSSAGDTPRVRYKRLLTLITILSVSFIALPAFHGFLLYGASFFPIADPAVSRHILVNCALSAGVMMAATRAAGRLDRKIAYVVATALLVHGLLAFFILLTRQYYSNQIMLTAGAISIVLGLAVMTLAHRNMAIRAALLGGYDPIVDQLRVPCDIITDPARDLRLYDILFTTDLARLSPDWAKAVSKAMLQGRSVRHLAEYLEEDRGLVSIEHFDLEHLPAGGLTSYRVRKRLMDIGLVLLSLPITVPLLLFGALAVRVSMGGPVMFTQPRVGLGGRTFMIYKLRTMSAAPAVELTRATVKGDARITPLGSFLRRFRIDELPQLWNVLKGDMSVIGPRPEQPLLCELYTRDLPAFAYRHVVRPGITGWAQVRGDYAADLAETRPKLAYDLFYIKNLSFALDAQILVRTISTLVMGSNAR